MRGRLLAGFMFALASMTAWAGAMPLAHSAPVAVAYSVDSGQPTLLPTTPAPRLNPVSSSTTTSSVRFDWRNFRAAQETGQPADPTPVQLSTPAPQDDPTAAPDATPKPNATNMPEATGAPEATDSPAAKFTASPTPKPTGLPTPKPQASPTPKPSASPTAGTGAATKPRPSASLTPRPTATATPRPSASPTPRPTATATPRPTASPTPAPTAIPAPRTYSGRSHFWFPDLNIDVDWGWYGCDYGGPDTLPGGVWRWGCGPRNNIYFLSHAWSTFKKVKIAYNNGSLKVGQHAWYADAQGNVTRFEVKWTRRVTVQYLNETASEWALNDSPTPIITLQTCDGADNQLRIIVRLVPA